MADDFSNVLKEIKFPSDEIGRNLKEGSAPEEVAHLLTIRANAKAAEIALAALGYIERTGETIPAREEVPLMSILGINYHNGGISEGELKGAMSKKVMQFMRSVEQALPGKAPGK